VKQYTKMLSRGSQGLRNTPLAAASVNKTRKISWRWFSWQCGRLAR